MRFSNVRVPRRLAGIALPALGLAVILIAVVTATLFTHPTVRITLAEQDEDTSIPITVVDPTVVAAGDIPGLIREVTVEVTGTAPTTGSTTLPGTAEGTVTIVNHWSQVQPLAATTRLLSEGGVLFRTTARVDVPPGGSIDVAVAADQPGASGNVPPGRFTIVALWAGLQDQIFGSSSAPMAGGGTTGPAVTTEDLAAAEAIARGAAEEAAIPLLTAELPAGTALIPESIGVVAVRTLNRSSVDDATATARVELRASVRGLLVAPEPFTAAVRTAAQREHPGETITGITARPDLAGATLPGGPFTVAVGLQLVPGEAALSASRIAGQTPEAASAALQRVPGVTAVDISGLPFWARTLPSAERIRVIIDSPAP